mgnify:CR=1 FL=1
MVGWLIHFAYLLRGDGLPPAPFQMDGGAQHCEECNFLDIGY